MEHPLLPDLTDLSTQELQEKCGEIQKRMNFAFKAGYAHHIGQLQMLLSGYQTEIQKRAAKDTEAMMERLNQRKNIQKKSSE